MHPGTSFSLVTACCAQLTNQQGDNKIRSHARAETDWIFVPELGASPRPQATGWHPVQGRKSSQFLHGRDFLILFHHFYSCKYNYIQF